MWDVRQCHAHRALISMYLPPERRPLCAPRAPGRLTRALTTCLGSAQITSTSAAVQVVADPRVISQRSGAPAPKYCRIYFIIVRLC
jgi:hypothetical protein